MEVESSDGDYWRLNYTKRQHLLRADMEYIYTAAKFCRCFCGLGNQRKKRWYDWAEWLGVRCEINRIFTIYINCVIIGM